VDELVKQLVLGAPNLVIAIAVLLWARTHIKEKDDEIRRLTDIIIDECLGSDGTEGERIDNSSKE